MNKLMLLFAGLATIQIAADYTHTITIDQKVKNTPGTYEFIIGSPANRFSLVIADNQKLSIVSRHNVEATIKDDHLEFSMTNCLEKINLQITSGTLNGTNITVKPLPVRRSVYGPSSCAMYEFSLSMDTQNNLRFKEMKK